MQIKADEISAIIKEKIKGFDKRVDVNEMGTVIQVGDGIAKIYGLNGAMAGEMLEFPGNLYGMALNLEEDNVGAVLMGEDTGIKEGDPVKRTGRIAEVPVGEALIGRVVSALGLPLDGKGPIKSSETPPPRGPRAGRGGAPVRPRAHADRPQGHRCHDSHRPGPAGVDHRRPPDG